MKAFDQRLDEIYDRNHAEIRPRLVFLLNPKNLGIIEGIVAWTVQIKTDTGRIQVGDNASLDELWDAVPPDLDRYAETLGVTAREALARFSQLKNLGLIYPNGRTEELAMGVVGTYMKKELSKLSVPDKGGERG